MIFACGRLEEPTKAQKPQAIPKAALAKQETPKQEPLAKEHAKKESAQAEDKHHQLHDETDMPMRAQYPNNMKVEGGCSGEGCGFTFSFKPQGNALDKSKAHIFLPRGAATAVEQERFVTGTRGLLESNGWKKEGETIDTGKFPFEGIRKVITFADFKNKGMVGTILLGETSGQAVQVILYYPVAMGKEFFHNANYILSKLHFKSDKLSLRRSH